MLSAATPAPSGPFVRNPRSTFRRRAALASGPGRGL